MVTLCLILFSWFFSLFQFQFQFQYYSFGFSARSLVCLISYLNLSITLSFCYIYRYVIVLVMVAILVIALVIVGLAPALAPALALAVMVTNYFIQSFACRLHIFTLCLWSVQFHSTFLFFYSKIYSKTVYTHSSFTQLPSSTFFTSNCLSLANEVLLG